MHWYTCVYSSFIAINLTAQEPSFSPPQLAQTFNMLFPMNCTATCLLLVSATAVAAPAADAQLMDVTLVERGSWDA